MHTHKGTNFYEHLKNVPQPSFIVFLCPMSRYGARKLSTFDFVLYLDPHSKSSIAQPVFKIFKYGFFIFYWYDIEVKFCRTPYFSASYYQGDRSILMIF